MIDSRFFSELKRRNVFRAGATYAVLAWVLMQVADIVLPAFSAPEWVLRVFLFFLIAGFPLVLLASWVYELTPEGFKRTNEVDPALSIRGETGEKLNYITIGSVVVLLLVTLLDRPAAEVEATATDLPLASDAAAIAPAAQEHASSIVTDKSIAVLPLDDFNAGGEEAYFADGLTEEILNALTRTPDLLVASRTSSFQYKDLGVDIQDVAQDLGVAHVLEGSVRRSAERLRVTVQLIRASDGFHLWSENYDRTPDDIIAVQEDIAFQIATALKTAMDPEALRQMVQSGTRSVAAYNAYLQGQALAVNNVGASLARTTYEHFELARQIDPGFARAHERAALYWQNQLQPNLIRSAVSTAEPFTPVEKLAMHEERISQAIAAEKGPEQWLYRMRQARVNLQYRAAFGYAQQYLKENPGLSGMGAREDGFSQLMVELAQIMGEPELALSLLERFEALPNWNENAAGLIISYFYIGEFARGRELALKTVEANPFAESLLYQSHRLLLAGGFVDEARPTLNAISGAELGIVNLQLARLRQACADGEMDTANRIAAELLATPRTDASLAWQTLHLMGRSREAAEMLQTLDQPDLLYSLSSYLQYPYFDISYYPNLKAVLERDRVPLPVYQPIPYACPAPANQ